MAFVRIYVFGTTFDLPARYQDPQPIGIGAFGLVCSTNDCFTGLSMAIKKIAKPYATPASSRMVYRELKLLKHFQHANIVHLNDIFFSPAEDLYVVTELLDTDLQRLLESQTLEGRFIQYFVYQLLCGLKYIHSAGIVHRDIKPANILLNENMDLKICDFGSARPESSQMTGYVSTRYYRAPEVMVSWQKYDVAIDVWSAGCVFAEMFQGQPLFAGKNHIQQLSLIIDLLGTPTDDVIERVCNRDSLGFLQRLPRQPNINFSQKFHRADVDAIDLLEKMLVFDPQTRIDCIGSLEHKYLAQYHDLAYEPIAETFDWAFSDALLPVATWKVTIRSEIAEFHISRAAQAGVIPA